MNILVTGAAGFIGSNTCDYLLKKGHKVFALDNFNDYYSRKIKEFNISELVNNSHFVLLENDITDREFIKNLFTKEGIQGVVHLAAWAGVTDSVTNPSTYVYENIDGTNNLLEFGVASGVKKFVFASTSSVYGNFNKTPFKEDMITDYPAAPYPASKKACEVLLYSYSDNFDIDITIFRIFNPIGPRMRPDLALPKLIRSALYGTTFELWMDPKVSMRDYAYIDEMISTFEKALIEDTDSKYKVLNLGNSDPRSLVDLKNIVEKVVGSSIKVAENYKPGQMKETYADITRAKDTLGYSPTLTLEQMVKKYYDWFINQPDWYKEGKY